MTPLVTCNRVRAADCSGPHELDPQKVKAYMFAMMHSAKFPPIRVVRVNDGPTPIYLVIDGHHRVAAAKQIDAVTDRITMQAMRQVGVRLTSRLPGQMLTALVMSEEDFEQLDLDLRDAGEGHRADDPQFWTNIEEPVL